MYCLIIECNFINGSFNNWVVHESNFIELSSDEIKGSFVCLHLYLSYTHVPQQGQTFMGRGAQPPKKFSFFFFFFFCVIWPSHHIHKAGSGHCAPARRHSELCFLYQLNIVFNYNRMCFEYYITWNMLAYHGCPEWSCKNYKSKRCFYWVARDLGCGVK
jgi:hypothetical protein